MYRKFKPLKIPDGWEQYWSKYPNGYSIIEALIDWVSQVDDMVDNVNSWNEYLDNFVATFDKELQQVVTDTLSEWQVSGFLDVVISEALQWEFDDFKATTEQNIYTINQQLQHMHYDVTNEGTIIDGDITDILERLISEGKQIFIPEGEFFWTRPIKTSKSVNISGLSSTKTILRYKPTLDNGGIGLTVHGVNWAGPLLAIDNLAIYDVSQNTEKIIEVGHTNDGESFMWGARVSVTNSIIRGYANKGLSVIAPYNLHIFNTAFRGKDTGITQPTSVTPVTKGTGLHLTGVKGPLKTFGNVNKIEQCVFTDNKYGVDLYNVVGTLFENCTFENNWIPAYMHSDETSLQYTRTSRIRFDNCWFEAVKNGHPDIYLVDCYMNENTGVWNADMDKATSITSVNCNYVARKMGLPASKGYNTVGSTWSSDYANEYLFRQWDRGYEFDGGNYTDGNVAVIGGERPYYRGLLALNGGLERHQVNTRSYKPDTKITEKLEIFDVRIPTATSSEYVYEINLQNIDIPSHIDGHVNTLHSKFTFIFRTNDFNVCRLETDALFNSMGSGGSVSYDSYQSKFTENTQVNLSKIDTAIESVNNNLGVRIERTGSVLKIRIKMNGFKGGTIFMENKFYTHRNTSLL